MKITDTSDMWWKTAVIYCLDVETFLDWNGDGIGDMRGLAQRIDYLADLGITCLWLMPFYPTPDRDDGYDITDFYGVDSRLGTHGDLVEIIRTARDRGIRVIADLVVNHTSDQHPWFRSARASKDSPFRDFYVWRSDQPPDTSSQTVFPGTEKGIWQYDKKTREYYLHRFYKHQPDLNVANSAVREEIEKVLGFWLEVGLSGFRIDAVPFLIETIGAGEKERDSFADPHDHLRNLRSFVGRRSGDAFLLGEVNLPYKDQTTFFGGPDGDELTMQFDFIGMQNLYLSLARGDARPLAKALGARPSLSPDCQWATFVRNHDELTLDKLTDDERAEVFAAFGPEKKMQIYGRGLIRRLPPMLGGDPRRIRMVYSLLFSLPGTPVLFYGEEIGLGENLDAGERMAVRPPMQWTADRNGGFSTAKASQLVGPVVQGAYGPDHVNVNDQRQDPDSLLNFMSMLIRRYRECPELGWAELEIIKQPHFDVVAHRCTWGDGSMLAVHNLSSEPRMVPIRLADCDDSCELVDLLQTGRTRLGGSGDTDLELDGYGYRWLRVTRLGDRRLT
jgi:trehalose synthase